MVDMPLLILFRCKAIDEISIKNIAMNRFFIKFLNILSTLRIKLYPRIISQILKVLGVVFGKNLQIPGKLSWLIGGVS